MWCEITYCKFAVNDIKNTIFILLLSHWMISFGIPFLYCSAGRTGALSVPEGFVSVKAERRVWVGGLMSRCNLLGMAAGLDISLCMHSACRGELLGKKWLWQRAQGRSLERWILSWSLISDCRKGEGEAGHPKWLLNGRTRTQEDRKARRSSEGMWVEQFGRMLDVFLFDTRCVSSAV